MVKRTLYLTIGLTAAVLLVLILVGVFDMGEVPPAGTPDYDTSDPGGFLEASKGRVVVLLLGTEGCPGTKRGTENLAKYAGRTPEGVIVARVDVPAPGGSVEPVSDWSQPYLYFVDEGRKVAERLEFFFYPTLYIIDLEGEVRFSGGTDIEQVTTIVDEILAEDPSGPKKVYTPPLPPVGSKAIPFRATTLADEEKVLADLQGPKGTLLFFTSISCPFSTAALSEACEIVRSLEEKGIRGAVINKQEDVEKVKAFYAEKELGLPIIHDESGRICPPYGVDAVPTFFLLDADGNIVARGPYTRDTAMVPLSKMLGIPYTPTGRGGGG